MNISLFYVCFYAAVGAYTWAMMAIFMGITKSGYPIRPKYAGTDGVLGTTFYTPGRINKHSLLLIFQLIVPFSGMGVRPHIGNGLSAVSYSPSDPSFYKAYFDTFLAG